MNRSFQNRFADLGVLDAAPGSVFGLRWWLMSPTLEVRGAANGIWRVGEENIAECRDASIVRFSPATGAVWYPSVLSFLAPHRAPEESCACGFYGFWDATSAVQVYPEITDVVIVGVIEGYGKTLIGDLGFKSEKARIRGVVTSLAAMHWSATFGLASLSIWLQRQQGRTAGAAAGIFERAGIPVYPDQDALLAAHPLTTEYRRQEPATPDPSTNL